MIKKNIHGLIVMLIIGSLLYFNQINFQQDIIRVIIMLFLIFIVRQLMEIFKIIIKSKEYVNHSLFKLGFYGHPITGILPFYEKIGDKVVEGNSYGKYQKLIKFLNHKYMDRFLLQPFYQVINLFPKGGAYTFKWRKKEELVLIRSISLITSGFLVLIEIERIFSSIFLIISFVYIYFIFLKPLLAYYHLIRYEKFTYKEIIHNRFSCSIVMSELADEKYYYYYPWLKNEQQYLKGINTKNMRKQDKLYDGSENHVFFPEDTYFYSETLLSLLSDLTEPLIDLEYLCQYKGGIKNRERIKGTDEDIRGTPGDGPRSEDDIIYVNNCISTLEDGIKGRLEKSMKIIYKARLQGLKYVILDVEKQKKIEINNSQFYSNVERIQHCVNPLIKKEGTKYLTLVEAKKLYNELWEESLNFKKTERFYISEYTYKESEYGRCYAFFHEYIMFGGGGIGVEEHICQYVEQEFKILFEQNN